MESRLVGRALAALRRGFWGAAQQPPAALAACGTSLRHASQLVAAPSSAASLFGLAAHAWPRAPPTPTPWRGFAAGSEQAMKTYKPTSPGQRGRVTTSRVGLHKGRPIKALSFGLTKSGGRNNLGRITSRHRGGGAKRLYRMVDFARTLSASRGVVQRLEYDPNRSARIALVDYAQPASPGSSAAAPAPVYSYILAPEGLKAGDSVASGPKAGIFPGNALAMRDMPAGTTVHNLEMRPGSGGKLVRAAGTSATLVKKGEDGYVTVRLASGEQRLLREECMATVGSVSNKEHHNRKLGKAGISRHLGRRPSVRGVAMNPIDHPHGGGEGKTSGGRPSVTPWGRPTKGYRTRKNKRTDDMIVERRYGRK